MWLRLVRCRPAAAGRGPTAQPVFVPPASFRRLPQAPHPKPQDTDGLKLAFSYSRDAWTLMSLEWRDKGWLDDASHRRRPVSAPFTFERLVGARSFFPDAVALNALLVAVIFIGQELAGHRDLDSVALLVRQPLDLGVKIDGRHDAIAEFLFDERLPRRSIDHH